MKLAAFIIVCLGASFMAAPSWAAPTQRVAIAVKPITTTTSTKNQKRIKHPLLLRVKRARTQARSKAPVTAKQFDLSGALRSSK